MSAAVPGSADCVGWLAPVVVGLEEDVADEQATELGIDENKSISRVGVSDVRSEKKRTSYRILTGA